MVVSAKDESEASAKVEEVLSESWYKNYCDGYVLYNEIYFIERWGEKKSLSLDTEEGKKKLEELIRSNIKTFEECLQKAIDKKQSGDYETASHYARMAGGHPYKMSLFLWGDDSVFSKSQVDRIGKNTSDKLWIVPFDIHY